jgi:hypothetical protein
MGVRWTIDGREVPLDQGADELVEAVMRSGLRSIRQEIEALLEGVTCPVHGEPSLTVNLLTSDAHDRHQLVIDGACCEQLRQVVEDLLDQALGSSEG